MTESLRATGARLHRLSLLLLGRGRDARCRRGELCADWHPGTRALEPPAAWDFDGGLRVQVACVCICRVCGCVL